MIKTFIKHTAQRSDRLILGPQTIGRMPSEPVHLYQRGNGISKKRVTAEVWGKTIFHWAPGAMPSPWELTTYLGSGWLGFRWKPGTSVEVISTTTTTLHGRRTWGGNAPEEKCPLLIHLMTFLPKKILSWKEEHKLMTNHFGVRFIELKESQLKSFHLFQLKSWSEQPFHFPETFAHGNELLRSLGKPVVQP